GLDGGSRWSWHTLTLELEGASINLAAAKSKACCDFCSGILDRCRLQRLPQRGIERFGRRRRRLARRTDDDDDLALHLGLGCVVRRKRGKRRAAYFLEQFGQLARHRSRPVAQQLGELGQRSRQPVRRLA